MSGGLLRDIKAAYLRGEEVHQVMVSRGGHDGRDS